MSTPLSSNYRPSRINSLILAPLSVSLVVLILGAAFGELIGVGATVGMVSSAVALTITSLVGGSDYGITSPTGPMSAAMVVVLAKGGQLIQEHQLALSPIQVGQLVVLGAAIILLLCIIFRLTTMVKYIPNVVVVGFVNGIAALIVIQQFKNLTGWEDITFTLITTLVAIGFGAVFEDRTHIAWRLLASTTSVVVVMSLFAQFISWHLTYPHAEIIGLAQFTTAITLPPITGLPTAVWLSIGILAIEVALIGLFDTLLTSLLLERQTNTPHHYDREIVGQSISMGSIGVLGGIPVAQSTVPSMMYYQEGAYGRASRVMLVMFTLILLIISRSVIQLIPDAVLSGVILKIAWDIADITSLRHIVHYHSGRNRWALLVVVLGTTIATVIFSLNAAVIGFALGFYAINHTVLRKRPVPDLALSEHTQGMNDEL